MAEGYKIVRSPVLEDQELPEIHYHNDVDQPAISLGDLPAGTDHSTLSNVTVDQHHARDHASRHLSGGGDALTLTATEVPTSAWAADIIPALDSAYDLGSTTVALRVVYVDTIKSITGNALALTPIAGQSLTINLATTGDFIVNTNHLVVDTSTGYVGIGKADPGAKLHVVGGLLAGGDGVETQLQGDLLLSRAGFHAYIYGNHATNELRIRTGGSGKVVFQGDTATGAVEVGQSTNIVNFQTYGNSYLATNTGSVGIGTASPTAVLHLKAGTATANTAPLKLTSGTLNTTPEAGAIEFDGTNLYFVNSAGTRKTIAVV